MSFKKSCSNVQKNKNIWASNRTSYQDSVKIRGNNCRRWKILLRVEVIGRYKFLGIEMKSKSERSYEIGKELKGLWQKKN